MVNGLIHCLVNQANCKIHGVKTVVEIPHFRIWGELEK